jgi:Phosphopantetheine attachment site.
VEPDEKFDEKILSLIAEAVPKKYKKTGITKDMRLLADLGIDSLGIAALVFRLEEMYGISVDDIDFGAGLSQMRTVGDAIDMSRNLVKQAKTAN